MNENDPYYQLDKKIDKTGDDIKSRLENLEKTAVKKEDLKDHYATKSFVWERIIGAFIITCGAYLAVTSMYIDSKTSHLNEDVGKILKIVESTLENKSTPK